MKKVIKIGIQNDGTPIWLEGEVDEEELRRMTSLLKVILESMKRQKRRKEDEEKER